MYAVHLRPKLAKVLISTSYRMAYRQKLSYSAVVAAGGRETGNQQENSETEDPETEDRGQIISRLRTAPVSYGFAFEKTVDPGSRQVSGSWATDQSGDEQATNEKKYVLSLSTDEYIFDRMTEYRKKYFPKDRYTVDAHVTLFHALPERKLNDTIIPAIEDIARKTERFMISASYPFKWKKGFAVGLNRSRGGREAGLIHERLKNQWANFLSKQDVEIPAMHYTLMNKVEDEEEVNKAFAELSSKWEHVTGDAIGLTLWLYKREGWEFVREFSFQNLRPHRVDWKNPSTTRRLTWNNKHWIETTWSPSSVVNKPAEGSGINNTKKKKKKEKKKTRS